MTIGYTAGVYDLFHIGHLTLLKNAKGLCDKLIVGVTTDELVLYKGKHSMIPYSDRAEIVRSIKYVDAVVPQSDMDKLAMCKKLGANYLFVGDDWYGTDKWKKYEEEFAKAMKEAYSLPEEELHRIGENGFEFAMETLSRKNLKKLADACFDAINSKR